MSQENEPKFACFLSISRLDNKEERDQEMRKFVLIKEFKSEEKERS